MSTACSREPRLAVVGTGALGSALLDRLRERRFRSVLLVDPDRVEPRNLPISPLLQRAVEDAGPAVAAERRNKAELLAAAARDSDGLRWTARAAEIADVGWAELAEVDVLCCCTDSVLSRVETAWVARALGKPMLDAGVRGEGAAGGRVSVFPPAAEAACFLCGLTEERRAAVLGYAASASLGCQAPETVPAMTAAVDTVYRVADGMMTRLLHPQTFAAEYASSSRLSQEADGTWREEPLKLVRSAACPWHERLDGVLEALPWEQPLGEALRGENREVVLSWPVCVEAVCAGCGTRSEPRQRVARVRRTPCRACGSLRMQPLRPVQRIRRGDPHSEDSPRQLGMPERHLYWMRSTGTGAQAAGGQG